MSSSLLLASNNRHKLRELHSLLGSYGGIVLRPADIGLNLDVDETGRSFEENARLKAEAFCRASGMMSLADDSGLQVDALGGEPGIYSARYGGVSSDLDRIHLVLDRMKEVPEDERTARFVACIAIARPGRDTVGFRGEVEGRITFEPRGDGGFGYDPIFFHPPHGCTFAEMTPGMKAQVSHRGKALAEAVSFLMRLCS